jgi:alcohol dehydrogenase class IV
MQQLINRINCLDDLASLAEKKGVAKILMIAGKHLLEENNFKNIIIELKGELTLIHPPDGLLEIASIPSIETPDVIIAIGGGKAIDFAKAILEKNRIERKPYFIAAPTTAGSGSEATSFAVVYSGRIKHSLGDPSLLPDVVLLDGSLVSYLPKFQKAVSGADAFSQCIESLWNVHTTETSEGFALEGLRILFNRLPEFINSSDELLAQDMLWAAHLSGKAISFTKTTGPHALSYYLTAYHGIPHGQAVALFLPLFFLYNESKIPSHLFKILQVENAFEAFTTCTHFFKSLGLAVNFKELGVDAFDVDALLQSVNHQRFANNPVPFNKTVLKSLIQQYLL